MASHPPAGHSMHVVKIERKSRAKLGLAVNASHKGVQILGCQPGTASAECTGIEIGDMIIEINGNPTFGMTSKDVTKVLSRAKGTSVSLKLYRSPTVRQPGESGITMKPLTAEDIDDGTTRNSEDNARVSGGPQIDPALEEFERLEREITSNEAEQTSPTPSTSNHHEDIVQSSTKETIGATAGPQPQQNSTNSSKTARNSASAQRRVSSDTTKRASSGERKVGQNASRKGQTPLPGTKSRRFENVQAKVSTTRARSPEKRVSSGAQRSPSVTSEKRSSSTTSVKRSSSVTPNKRNSDNIPKSSTSILEKQSSGMNITKCSSSVTPSKRNSGSISTTPLKGTPEKQTLKPSPPKPSKRAVSATPEKRNATGIPAKRTSAGPASAQSVRSASTRSLKLKAPDNVNSSKGSATVKSGPEMHRILQAADASVSSLQFESSPTTPSPSQSQSPSRGSSRGSQRSTAVGDAGADSSFQRLRLLAKTDYNRFSALINPTGSLSRPNSEQGSLRSRGGIFRHELLQDGNSTISQWLCEHESTAMFQHCQRCSEKVIVTAAAASSPIPSARERRSSIPRGCLLNGVTPHDDDCDEKGSDASFHAFKYKVLLTQLEAARARRNDALTHVVTTRDRVQTKLQSAFGRQCPALDDLIAADDFASALSGNSDGEEITNPVPESGIPQARSMASRSMSTSSVRSTCSVRSAAPSAEVMCRAVLGQLGQVEMVHTSATEAVAILEHHCEKAKIAASGVEIRSVQLTERDCQSVHFRQGICHTRQGAVVMMSSTSRLHIGEAIVAVNGEYVLDEPASMVLEKLHSSDGVVTVDVTLESSLSCAFALRWFGDSDDRCCSHVSSANRWIKKIAAKVADDRRDVVVAALGEHRVVYDPPESPIPPVEQSSQAESPDPRWSVPDETTKNFWGASTWQNTQDDKDTTSEVGPVTRSPSPTESERVLPSRDLVDTVFAKSLYADFDPNETIGSVAKLSSLLEKPGADIDVSFSDESGVKHQYLWQRGPCSRAKMERRRIELLQMDMTESDELMNEWMMLLRARATVEHVDKLRARAAADAAAAYAMSREHLANNPAKKEKFLRKFRSLMFNQVSTLTTKTKRLSTPAASPAPPANNFAPNRTHSLPVSGGEASEARARMRALAAARMMKRQQQLKERRDSIAEYECPPGPLSPQNETGEETYEESVSEDWTLEASEPSKSPECSVVEAVSREDVDKRLKVLAAETKRRLKFEPGATAERKAAAAARAKELAQRKADLLRRTQLMQKLKESMDSTHEADEWIDDC
eukprot:m.454874 g.454874  ORF g.454874 m.454874 type:complete len:1283 (+) comp20758_c0_seq1:235-4083(+)